MACIPHKALEIMKKIGLSKGSIVTVAGFTQALPYLKSNLSSNAPNLSFQDANEIVSEVLKNLVKINDKLFTQNEADIVLEINGKEVYIKAKPNKKIRHHMDVSVSGELDNIRLSSDNTEITDNGVFITHDYERNIRSDDAELLDGLLYTIKRRHFKEMDINPKVKIKSIKSNGNVLNTEKLENEGQFLQSIGTFFARQKVDFIKTRGVDAINSTLSKVRMDFTQQVSSSRMPKTVSIWVDDDGRMEMTSRNGKSPSKNGAIASEKFLRNEFPSGKWKLGRLSW